MKPTQGDDMGITIRGNGLKANTPRRMGKANFLNKPEECKHGKMVVHCAPCFKDAKTS